MDTGRAVHRIKQFIPILAVVLGACGDSTAPAFWDATPDTLLMYSASVPEYIGFRSALDVVALPVRAVPIEASGATGQWDVALVNDGGSLALVAASAFEGLSSRSAVAVLDGAVFADVDRAPSDTSADTTQPVPLRSNAVYIIRSRRGQCGFTSGSRYAKLHPIEIDVAAGTFRFSIVRNPYCDDRSFVPPEQ
ncbi:hypothetical protein BH23GEM10_BH23GEM10_06160 [soil metagenome]